MIDAVGHPHIPLSDWQTFRKEFSPYLIKEVIDRSEINYRTGSYLWREGLRLPAIICCRRRVIVLARIALAAGAKQNVTFLLSVPWRTKI